MPEDSPENPTDEQVRRLLADARHTDPVPPDVAERLDGVLADLRADRPLRPTVTDLAAARRRRRARTMLVAAAAVIVVGVGVNQVRDADLGGSGDEASSSADSAAGATAERSGAADAPSASGADGDAHALTDGRPEEEAGLDAQYGFIPPTAGTAARITSENFGVSVLELRRMRPYRADLQGGAALTKARCTGRDTGAGDIVAIRYDGNPAVLIYRPPRGETQVVDLYVCGRDGVVRTITLPAR